MRKLKSLPDDALYYQRVGESLPGVGDREMIPLAIPYNTAHSGSEYSVVDGSRNNENVGHLVKRALEAGTVSNWRSARLPFEQSRHGAR